MMCTDGTIKWELNESNDVKMHMKECECNDAVELAAPISVP
jgi:hypothetical protein